MSHVTHMNELGYLCDVVRMYVNFFVCLSVLLCHGEVDPTSKVFVYLCVYLSIYVYMYVCVCVCTYMYMYMTMYVCMCICDVVSR